MRRGEIALNGGTLLIRRIHIILTANSQNQAQQGAQAYNPFQLHIPYNRANLSKNIHSSNFERIFMPQKASEPKKVEQKDRSAYKRRNA